VGARRLGQVFRPRLVSLPAGSAAGSLLATHVDYTSASRFSTMTLIDFTYAT
jgi:hypothetical protein